MLLNYLNELKGLTTREEFEDVLKMTEDDIKFNKVRFNKKTSVEEFILICNRSLSLVKRYC